MADDKQLHAKIVAVVDMGHQLYDAKREDEERKEAAFETAALEALQPIMDRFEKEQTTEINVENTDLSPRMISILQAYGFSVDSFNGETRIRLPNDNE